MNILSDYILFDFGQLQITRDKLNGILAICGEK